MKKLLISILIISLIIALLSGCKDKKNEELEQQITDPPKSSETTSPMPSTTPISTPIPTPEPTPTQTYEPARMAKNFILPEELDTIIEGAIGGYDFSIPYDTEKWFQVDNKNMFVMKFAHIDSSFPWAIASSNNSYLVNTVRTSDYDYLILKFMQANTETIIVFEAVNEDGVVGSTLSDSPNGIYFAVANR